MSIRYIRSNGTSFTTDGDVADCSGDRRLRRGLAPSSSRTSDRTNAPDGAVITPTDLPDFLADDPTILVRQLISILDKVVRKPRTPPGLRAFELQAYVDRTLLSVALWRLVHDRLAHRLPETPERERLRLRRMWDARVHPYAVAEYSPSDPGSDGNARIIRTHGQQEHAREHFNGRWHDAFWIRSTDGRPDYAAIAQAIIDHLTRQEITVAGKPRVRGGGESGIGLSRARGEAIVNSANDPRTTTSDRTATRWSADDEDRYFEPDIAERIHDSLRDAAGRLDPLSSGWFDAVLDGHFRALGLDAGGKDASGSSILRLHDEVRQYYRKLAQSERFQATCRSSDPQEWRDALPGDRKALLAALIGWSAADEEIYFRRDVARQIHDTLCDYASKPDRISTAWFGKVLYEHFGALGLKPGGEDGSLRTLFRLHNKVRQYYQKLARSERFRIAYRSNDPKELRLVLPENREALLAALTGRRRNAEIGAAIRLGKLIAHSVDPTRHDGAPDQAFRRRLDYLATSAGQSEIKRNEVFTRVWRNSVALSLRTVSAWRDALIEGERNQRYASTQAQDLSGANASRSAVKLLDPYGLSDDVAGSRHANHRRQTEILFGRKVIDLSATRAGPAAPCSRASLLQGDTREGDQSILWGMLRLAGEFRNRVNHFSTMDRVIDVVSGGLVKATEDAASMASGQAVSQFAIDAFERLLQHDRAMTGQVVLDELRRLHADRFIGRDHLVGHLLPELMPGGGQPSVLTPRFTALIRHLQNLEKNSHSDLSDGARRLTELRLDPTPGAEPSADSCRTGLLRALYRCGFERWLETEVQATGLVREAAERVIEAKRQRILQYQGDHDHLYRFAEPAAEQLRLQDTAGPQELTGLLASIAMADRPVGRGYDPSKPEQRRRAAWVEDFRKELFADLFCVYLDQKQLSFIWNASELPDSEVGGVDFVDCGTESTKGKSWHSQFYAWLYLVPRDSVAMLRHQLRKTLALEHQGQSVRKDEIVDLIRDLDDLMGLYTTVQSAGFDGTEHQDRLGFGPTLFEDTSDFTNVYSEKVETHQESFPGTRRGLRLILRFGHLPVLDSLFKRHKITTAEVKAFVEIKNTQVEELMSRRVDTHQEIERLSDERPTNERELQKLCASYRDATCDMALYNFQARAARLSEHARLHDLMMRVIGRLSDFTLLWERDRICVFLGYLARRMGDSGLRLVAEPNSAAPDRVAIALPPELKAEFATLHRRWIDESADDSKRRLNTRTGGRPLSEAVDLGQLPVWSREFGFDLPDFAIIAGLLPDSDRQVFNRHFGTLDVQNPRDNPDLNPRADGKTKKGNRTHGGRPAWSNPKGWIRNDFAHYNMLRQRGGPISLTYLTNAVRSLLSYDRKLKNAVSKAVSDILLDNGLIVEWRMQEDRLVHPTVTPAVETHLALVPRSIRDSVQFVVPKASVRFTSMVQALFDFEKGGHRDWVTEDGKKKRKGPLSYPKAFLDRFADGPTLPSKLCTSYEAVGPDSPQ